MTNSEQFDFVKTETADIELTPEERDDLEQSTGYEETPIRFRNQDFDVKGLVDRMERGDIIIPRIGLHNESLEMNAFQRGFVWNNRQMDSFIESLLLEYPTPSIFLVQQQDRTLVVLDGQQRLETLRRFYSKLRAERKYKLHLPESKFNGLAYDELETRYRRLLDNTYITTTVILSSSGDEFRAYKAIYDVFARLNSGGAQLTPHEIRIALYNGKLMEVVDEVNTGCPYWRQLYGNPTPNKRFRDHELILRVIALFLDSDSYRKPLASFLNHFSAANRDASSSDVIRALRLFEGAARALADSGYSHPFSVPGGRQLNTARVDSIMVGLMATLIRRDVTPAFIASSIEALNANPDYLEATSRSTSDELQVASRISIAKKAFGDE